MKKIAESKIEITKTSIEASSRRLRATWTLEAAKDLIYLKVVIGDPSTYPGIAKSLSWSSMHGVDVEKELMEHLARELAAEIDADILASIKNLALK